MTAMITNPGPQSNLTNTAVSLQIVATGASSFNSTTLPPGLSINTSGLITGSPTTAGTYSVTVDASPSLSTMFAWVINVSVMYYQGSAGRDSIDDQPILIAAIEDWYSATSVYPSVIVFSGLVCFGSTFYPPPGTNITGAVYQFNRFGGSVTGGSGFLISSAVIAPLNTSNTGPLIQFGQYGSGWDLDYPGGPWEWDGTFSLEGENPHVFNLGFCGRPGGIASDPAIPGLVGIAAEDVGDGRILHCSFDGFDNLGIGNSGVLGGAIRIESSGGGDGLTSEGWHLDDVAFLDCGYGVIFLGPMSTDGTIRDIHSNGTMLPVVLGVGPSDNAGGALVSDCHFVGNTPSTWVTLASNDTDITSWDGTQTLNVADASEFELQSGAIGVASITWGDPVVEVAYIQYKGTGTGELKDCTFLSGSVGTTVYTNNPVNAAIAPATLIGSGSAVDYLPSVKAHITSGPGPGGQCNWHLDHSYFDKQWDAQAAHIYVNGLGAQIVGCYFIAQVANYSANTPGQIGPAFIVFDSGISLTHGPDCIITDNVFDQGNGGTYGDGTYGEPNMFAMAQLLFVNNGESGQIAYVGMIRNNRFRAYGTTMLSRTDTATVTDTMTTVTDASIKDWDLNALLGTAHFPPGTRISLVTVGSGFTASAAASSGGSSVVVYPCPGIVDANVNAIGITKNTALGFFEAPTLPQ
jgi:hypothetical protein